MKPYLSVIIADVNGFPEIGECLEALEQEQAPGGVEVIVIERSLSDSSEVIRRKFPWAQLIIEERFSSITELRNAGFDYSQGEVVAILEDHEAVPPGWCERMVSAHRAYPETPAIAGPIENGRTERIVDWAAFFCEYCQFMPPIRSGFTETIPGNNVAYKRWAVEAIPPEERKGGFWESTLHPVLLRQGCLFRLEPEVWVSHEKSFGFVEYLVQRYHYSRYYASLISKEYSLAVRFVRLAACIFLPAFLMKRILSCGFSKQRFRKELLMSIPLLVIFTITWAVGEIIGLLLGQGRSLSLIE